MNMFPPSPIDADASDPNCDNAHLVTNSITMDNNVDDTTVVTASTLSVNAMNVNNPNGTYNDDNIESARNSLDTTLNCIIF